MVDGVLRDALARARMRLALAREDVEALERALAEHLPPPDLVPASVVAQQLRRAPRTVHRWVRDFGIGQTIRGRVFVDKAKLSDFIRQQAGAPCDQK